MLCVTKPILGDNYSVSLGNLFCSIFCANAQQFIHKNPPRVHLVPHRKSSSWSAHLKQLLGSLKISFHKCFCSGFSFSLFFSTLLCSQLMVLCCAGLQFTCSTLQLMHFSLLQFIRLYFYQNLRHWLYFIKLFAL